MKPREARRKVVVGARMRLDGRWADVRILDASSHGFLVSTADAPPRGTCIELARGPAHYVARVMWQGNGRFGVQTRDRVCVDALLAPPTAATGNGAFDPSKGERRARDRTREELDQRALRNAWLGKTVEYASVAGAGAMAAMLIVSLFGSAFAAPMARISAALETPRP